MIKLKWKIIKFNTFHAIHNAYTIKVFKSTMGWAWTIDHLNVMVANCMGYSPTNDELSCKIQATKQFNLLFVQPIIEVKAKESFEFDNGSVIEYKQDNDLMSPLNPLSPFNILNPLNPNNLLNLLDNG